jgi:ERCC4-type nuclease
LIVTIDSREPSHIKDWLPKQFPQYKFQIKALKEGDFLGECENKKNLGILVERKFIGDLYSSVMGSKGKKGRFPFQVSRLTTHQCDKIVILLVTGSVDEYVYKMQKLGVTVDRDIIDGIIASVVVRDNIRVIIDYNEKNALKRMIRTMQKVCDGQLDIPAHRNCDALAARLLNITLIQWKAIRDTYGTDLSYIASLSDKQLMDVDGIGKVKARKIREMLTGKCNDWLVE